MSTKVVVDSSVIVKWLNDVDENNLDQANKLLADALKGSVDLFVPELAKYEIGNVLLIRKKLPLKEIGKPLKALHAFPIQFVAESEELAKETYSLAFNCKVTYYDASFMSLAKQYNATLITDNIKHQNKSKDITVKSLTEYYS